MTLETHRKYTLQYSINQKKTKKQTDTLYLNSYQSYHKECLAQTAKLVHKEQNELLFVQRTFIIRESAYVDVRVQEKPKFLNIDYHRTPHSAFFSEEPGFEVFSRISERGSEKIRFNKVSTTNSHF